MGGVKPRAVVVTLIVAVEVFVPSGLIADGDTLHVAFEGAPEQASVTVLLKPPWGFTLRVYVAD